MRQTATQRYDLAGHPAGRIMRQDLIFRILPIGSFGGGPDLKLIVTFWSLHTFGRALFALKMRLEKPASFILRLRRSLHAR